MLEFPFLASAHACRKSSLIPFCALEIYETMYMAHAYTSSTNWISMFALHASREAGL